MPRTVSVVFRCTGSCAEIIHGKVTLHKLNRIVTKLQHGLIILKLHRKVERSSNGLVNSTNSDTRISGLSDTKVMCYHFHVKFKCNSINILNGLEH